MKTKLYFHWECDSEDIKIISNNTADLKHYMETELKCTDIEFFSDSVQFKYAEGFRDFAKLTWVKEI